MQHRSCFKKTANMGQRWISGACEYIFDIVFGFNNKRINMEQRWIYMGQRGIYGTEVVI